MNALHHPDMMREPVSNHMPHVLFGHYSLRPHGLSLDGKRVAVVSSEGIALVSVDGGEPQLVRGSQPGDLPLRWAKDDHTLFVGHRGDTACPV